MSRAKKIVCIGAGPAGLTAAQLLLEKGFAVTVLELDPQQVGGISRTVNKDNYLIDVGGHRFFTKSKKVEEFWTRTLGEDFLLRPRSSRIYYKNKFFQYPLRPIQAFWQLGFWESTKCLFSFLYWQINPVRNPKSFADWTQNRFGARLFEIFFATYTEKVWGMKCDEISADWAAQRIQSVSPISALFSSLRQSVNAKTKTKSLVQHFHYPKLGPGMMWEAVAEKIVSLGGNLTLDAKVTGITFDSESETYSVEYQNSAGEKSTVTCTDIVSSMPMRSLLKILPVPEEVRQISEKLRYRDFLIVALVLKQKEAFPDNWIYIHAPNVRVGRIQNFRAASPFMVPNPDHYCYGLEYFCNADEELWQRSDEDLVALAKKEFQQLGFARETEVEKGYVVRQPKAYPVYDHQYQQIVTDIRNHLADSFPNLHLVGRNGMHKYNNQDHSMMTAMLTVENIIQGKSEYNVWNVNQDAEYLEVQTDGQDEIELGIRHVPIAMTPNP